MSAQAVEKLFAAMQDSRGLPALESTVTSILGSLTGSSKGGSELVTHIIEDFALTQRVLRLANSPMYAPFAQDTSSVSGALRVVGEDALLHIVLGTAMVTESDMEDDHSLSKTLLASELARNVCADRQEEVSIAALMYDLGRLMVTKYLPAEMGAIDKKIVAGVEPDGAALEVLDMTLQQIGVEIAKRWKLPGSIVSIIDGTGDSTIVGVARFSSSASSLIHEGRVDEVNKLVSALDLPGVDKSKLNALIHRRVEELVPRPALSQAVPSELALDELFAVLTETRRKTVEELAAAMFPTLSEVLETARCLLFMITQSGDYGIRYGYGKGIDEIKSKLRISAEFKPTAFHAVIKNNVDVSIAEVAKLKPTALPDGYKTLLPSVNRFIILPIANSRVSGLVYCDWEVEKDLSQSELTVLRKLRNLFLPFFQP